MFDVFKKIFQDDGSSSFYSFYKKMAGWKQAGVYPFVYNLPTTISFPSDFWSDVIKIYKETREDGLERAVSLFWVDGELVLTSVVRGDEKSVSSNHRINVQYTAHPTRRGYLRRELMIDGKVTKRTDVYYKKAPKKVSIEYLFNIHTHPLHDVQFSNEKKGKEFSSSSSFNSNRNPGHGEYFSFFSVQDIKSFLTSKAVVTGLITDRLWLLVRTDKTPSGIDLKKLKQADISVDRLKENFKMVVYEAGFKEKAVKQ
jgi:hypothetical protein